MTPTFASLSEAKMSSIFDVFVNGLKGPNVVHSERSRTSAVEADTCACCCVCGGCGLVATQFARIRISNLAPMAVWY